MPLRGIALSVAFMTLVVLVAGISLIPRAGPASANPLAGISTVAAGAHHTCALMSDASVTCWGRNQQGQLGNGLISMSTEPNEIPVDASALIVAVTSVEVGGSHTCALREPPLLQLGGGVKCWGYNFYGSLGDGEACGNPCATPVDVSGLTNGVAAITAGGAAGHTCALTILGAVKCWGDNRSGQLGDGTTIDRSTPVDVVGLNSGIAAIDAGGRHACALTTSGRVKCWGGNSSGQLGNGTTEDSTTPVDVCAVYNIAAQQCGEVLSGITAITAGGSHTCGLTQGGGIKCWGQNGVGQLGNGKILNRTIPVNVCVPGTILGPFAEEGSAGEAAGIIVVPLCHAVDNMVAVTAGGQHSCAVQAVGLGIARRSTVMCWGYNTNGQLGDGTTDNRHNPVSVSGLAGLRGGVTASAGDNHTCAVLTGLLGVSALCWGYNEFGRLGDGTTEERHAPVNVVSVAKATATPTATATTAPTTTATVTPTLPATPTPTASPSTPTETPVASPVGLLGDVNCDGAINSIDAALVLQFTAGLITSLPCQDEADVNGDGEIDSVDAALILQLVAGLIDSLSPP